MEKFPKRSSEELGSPFVSSDSCRGKHGFRRNLGIKTTGKRVSSAVLCSMGHSRAGFNRKTAKFPFFVCLWSPLVSGHIKTRSSSPSPWIFHPCSPMMMGTNPSVQNRNFFFFLMLLIIFPRNSHSQLSWGISHQIPTRGIRLLEDPS